jgi:hypothetical protein
VRRVAVKVALGEIGIVAVVGACRTERAVPIPPRFAFDDEIVCGAVCGER